MILASSRHPEESYAVEVLKMLLALEVLTLALAGFMVGEELGIAAFVHPAMSRLADGAHRSLATALAILLGRVMPFWYAAVVLLTGAVAVAMHHATGSWPRLIVAATGLFGAAVVLSVTALVPLNNQVAGWTEAGTPADWKEVRGRWDGLHRGRVVLLAVAFVLLAVGVVG